MGSAVFASATSLGRDPESLVADLVSQVREQLGTEGEPGPVDLAVVFLSTNLTEAAASIASKLRRELSPVVMLGCSAEGVIGREEEVEGEAAATLVAGRLPGVKLAPFYFEDNAWRSALFDCGEFGRMLGAPDDVRMFILLGDPFSTPMDDMLEAFNNAFPDIPVIGGMASGALRPMGNSLILNDMVTRVGAVGVALGGPLEVHIVVSQGCRPVWRPFTVTHAQKNILLGLEDRPPLAWIQELIAELSEEDQGLLQNGLLVGRAINSQQEELGRGDFLIRGITGIDREKWGDCNFRQCCRGREDPVPSARCADCPGRPGDDAHPAVLPPAARRRAALLMQRPRHTPVPPPQRRHRGDPKDTGRDAAGGFLCRR